MYEPIGSIPLEMKADGIETRGVDWGDIRLRWIDLLDAVDFTPLLIGLPGDLCRRSHWGHVERGAIHVRYADGTEEVTSAGDFYYWPGGHTGWSGPDGVTFSAYSPADGIAPVLANIAARMGG